MNKGKTYIKFSDVSSHNCVDEIIISKTSDISKIFQNSSELKSITKPIKKENKLSNQSPNYLLNFSILSFICIALLVVFAKIVSTTFISFNSFTTSFFVGFYFVIFMFIIYFISKRKMLTLKIKDKTLLLRSFPALNQKIPISQILKCELNTMTNGKYSSRNKTQFALHENGNRYKQPITSGITLQLINGRHILISSYKS